MLVPLVKQSWPEAAVYEAASVHPHTQGCRLKALHEAPQQNFTDFPGELKKSSYKSNISLGGMAQLLSTDL